jgi:hypothetical protein
MKAIAFDTLEFANKLKAAHFTAEQAETMAVAMAALIDERVATKQDIEELKAATKRDIEELKIATKRDIEELKVAVKRDITELELRLKHDLTLRLGGMLAAAVAIVAALVKLL